MDPVPQADQGDEPQDPNPQDGQKDGAREPPLAASTPTKNVAAKLNKTSDARGWMSEFFDRHGDYIPDNDIMVIPFQSKRAVHDVMVQERGNKVAKCDTFCREWRTSFLKCKPLNDLKDMPTQNHTTITISTMKLSDINLPYFSSGDNQTGDTALPRVHLTGALFKVRSDESTHIFRNLNHISRDTNFVVHCLLNLLLRHKNQLDRTLLLQLHCQQSKINKQVLLSSVALLVDQQIFEKIFVRFLPDTSIIEAVETAFSAIDKKLFSADIPYVDDLGRIIGNITKGQVEEIKHVFDIEKWISSYLAEWSTNVNNQIWFKLEKNDKNTVMSFKPNLEAAWILLETVSDSTLPRLGNEGVFFKEPPDITTSPDFVPPRLASVLNLDAVEQTLRVNYDSELFDQYFNKWKSFKSSFDTYEEHTWQLKLLVIASQQQRDQDTSSNEKGGPRGGSPASAVECSSTQHSGSPANEKDEADKSVKTMEWLANFATENGIYIPNEHEMLLPFDSKSQVYKRMKKDLGDEGPNEKIFYEVLKRKFPRYNVYDERKEISTKIKNHHPIIGHTTVTITTLNPNNYNLPQLVPRDDRTDNLAKLNVHLTGGLFEDGNEPKPHIFRDLNHVPHDTNFIINCLLNLLVHHKRELRESLLLQLQWDQSGMIKNILLRFVFLLVDLNIFEEIYVRFLPQTPIIAAVSRIFSQIKRKLSKRNIPYIDDLDSAIRDTMKEGTKEVRVEEVTDVFNVERWMLLHLGECPFDAGNHMWFRFCRRDGTTFMYSKSSLDDPWPDTAEFTQTIPPTTATTIPEWVPPPPRAAVVDALKRDIPHEYSSRLSPENCENWESFLSSLDTYDQVPDLPESWPLQDLMTGEQ